MPTVELVLLTIKSVADAVVETCKLAQTDKGQAFLSRVLEDRAVWDKAWSDLGTGIKTFFSGALFKELGK